MIFIKRELLQLIEENCDLEVIPLVSYQATNYLDEDNTYNACKFVNPFKGKYCYFDFYGTKQFILEQNKILIEEYLYKYISEDKEIIKNELEKIEWKEAIFVYINQREEV